MVFTTIILNFAVSNILILIIMKKGDKIKIIRMDDSNGKDHQARMMNGRVVTVKFIDGIGQIHLEESGLALIPGTDEYELL